MPTDVVEAGEIKALYAVVIVAKKYLCICANSISLECIFSMRGNIVTDNQTCLKPDRVDQLVFFCQEIVKTCIYIYHAAMQFLSFTFNHIIILL